MKDSFSDLANKKYFGTADLEDGPVTVTITGYDKETVEKDGTEEKITVMSVEESEKGVIVKSTNLATLQELFGKPSNSVGKKVELFKDKNVTFGGKKTGGLRIRAAGPGAADTGTAPAPF